MCGIAGYRDIGEAARADLVHAMTAQLVHRGPDASAVYVVDGVALGHTRLSIIDLEHSAQPMTSADGRYTITYNGEIFNYKHLRANLIDEGVQFQTAGDTEVLLQVLIRWGKEGLHKLDGQFAFAFFDKQSSELMLCRDRLGILPLFYWRDHARVAFASEVKALLALPWVHADLDETAIDRYLATRSTCAPQTLFRNISKVKPGCYLRVDSAGTLEELRWWSLPVCDDLITDPIEAQERVLECLSNSVKMRLVADVPVGTYLSGGLDSSLVTALASRACSDPIRCFVAGFDDSRFDEVSHAKAVAAHCNATLDVVTVQPDDFMSAFEKLTWHRDAPISEPGDVAIYYIAKQARDHVKVLLSGEGADELFGGYPKHQYDRLLEFSDCIPFQVRWRLLRFLERTLGSRQSRVRVALRAIASRDREERWNAWFSPFTWYERKSLDDAFGGRFDVPTDPDPDFLNAMLRHDCMHWLSDNLLERGDRMSMAASVENRPPFLDHNLVELSFRIQGTLKIRGCVGKRILREIATDLLPRSILQRRKVGFKVPIDEWFRGRMRQYSRDLLLGRDSFVASRFRRSKLEEFFQRHDSGKNEDIRLWTLLGLEVWSRAFLGKQY